MAPSEIDYDVYTTPRMGAVQFGDFVAGDGTERENLLRAAQYVRRTHRARAWLAQRKVAEFLTSPSRNVGILTVAIDEAAAASEDPLASEQQQKDAGASKESLQGFLGALNTLPIGGKKILKIEDDQSPLLVGGCAVISPLSCLTVSVAKDGSERLGGIFLNTQVGKGLGAKEDTKRKRKKAGETVALIVLRRLIDFHSDIAEPYPVDALHVYARAGHVWPAPKSYAQKLLNIEADGRAVCRQWGDISAPTDFNPDRAAFHD